RNTGEAWDTIALSDQLVSIVNNKVGQLVPVTINTGSFHAPPGVAELTLNSGEEESFAANDIADDISISLSNVFRIQIHGGGPTSLLQPATQGDRLKLAPGLNDPPDPLFGCGSG